MRRSATTVAALVVGVLVWSPLEAQDSPNPWRDCGIGAAIFADNPTAAAISNVIWDSGTTGITSATSTPSACSGEAVQVAQFIHLTFPVLAMETAIGEGEHLVTLVQLAGCEAAATEPVARTLRDGFGDLIEQADYPTATYTERAFGYYLLVREATEASSLCASVI